MGNTLQRVPQKGGESRCWRSPRNVQWAGNVLPLESKSSPIYELVAITHGLRMKFILHLTSQEKEFNFATSKVKKKFNLTIDLLSRGIIYAPGPQPLTYRP